MAITYVGELATQMTTASTTMDFFVPSGLAVDDMMIAYVKANTATTVDTPPAGWALVGKTFNNPCYVFRKKYAIGDETFGHTVTFVGTAALNQAQVVAYRGVDSVGDFSTPASALTNATTKTHTTDAPVSTTWDDSMVLWLRDQAATAAMTFTWSGATERTDIVQNYTSGAFSGLSVAETYMATAGTPSTVTSTASTSAGGTTRMFSLVLNPPNNAPRFVGTSSSGVAADTITVDYPLSTVAGDFVLAYVATNDNVLTTSAVPAGADTPSGWTLLGSTNSGEGATQSIYYRVAGSETNVTFNSLAASSNDSMAAMLYTLRNVDTGTPINGSLVTGFSASGTSPANIPMPAITTTVPDTIVLKFFWLESTASDRTSTFPASAKTAFGRIVSQGNYGAGHLFRAFAGTAAAETVTLSGTGTDSVYAVLALQGPQSATIVDSDSGVGFDDAYANAVVPDGDSGSGSDSATNVLVFADSDVGASTDNASVQAAIVADADTGTGSDNATTAAVISDSDSGTGTDDGASSNTAVDSDQGTGTESDATLGVLDSSPEAGTGTDSASLNVVVDQQDSGSGSEADATINITTDIDTGTGQEVQVIIVTVSDTGSGTDQAGMPSALVVATDQGLGSEAQTVGVTADPDSGEGTDSAVRSVEGVLVAPRVYTIYGTSRTYTIYSENRTREIGPHYRTYVVLSQSSVGNS